LGKNSSVENIYKAVTENAYIKTVSKINAFEESKGFSKCEGIILGTGKIESVPAIYSEKNAELFHEASIGKIKEDVLIYLMSKGLSEEEATELYIKGFLYPVIEEIGMF